MPKTYTEEVDNTEAIDPDTTVDDSTDDSYQTVPMQPSKRQQYEAAVFGVHIAGGNSNVDLIYHVEESTDGGSSWSDLNDVDGNRYEVNVTGADDFKQLRIPNQREFGNDLRLAADSGDKDDPGNTNPSVSAFCTRLSPKETNSITS